MIIWALWNLDSRLVLESVGSRIVEFLLHAAGQRVPTAGADMCAAEAANPDP